MFKAKSGILICGGHMLVDCCGFASFSTANLRFGSRRGRKSLYHRCAEEREEEIELKRRSGTVGGSQK